MRNNNYLFKIFIPVIAFICLTNSIYSQQSTFSHVIYSEKYDIQGYSIVPSIDNGYIIAGRCNYKGMIVKTDSVGNPIWTKIIDKWGSTNNFYTTMYSIIQTNDSCYFVCGEPNNRNKGVSVFYMKISEKGDTLWTGMITSNEQISIRFAYQTSDSGYLIAERGGGFIAKIDKNGKLEWSKKLINNDFNSNFFSLQKAEDGSFYLTGYAYDKLNPDFTVFMIFLSSDGTYSHTNLYHLIDDGYNFFPIVHDQGSLYYFEKNITQNKDKGFSLLSGGSEGGTFIKTDSLLNSIILCALYFRPVDFLETSDNQFLLLGNGPISIVKNKNKPIENIAFVKIDENVNNNMCVDNLEKNFRYQLFDRIETKEIDFEEVNMGGYANAPITLRSEILLMKEGCVNYIGAIEELRNTHITLHPNPSSGIFTLEAQGHQPEQISIFNQYGQLVFENQVSHISTQIDVTHLQNGVYFYSIFFHDGEIGTGTIILVK